MKCSGESLSQKLQVWPVLGLSASYHRLQVSSSLRLSLPVLAELRVLFSNHPLILALKEKKTTAGVATALCGWRTWVCEGWGHLVLFHQRHHVCDLVLTLELRLVLVADGFCFAAPESVHLRSPRHSLSMCWNPGEPAGVQGCGSPLWWAPWPPQTWTGGRWKAWHGPPRWVFWGFEPPPGGGSPERQQTSFRVSTLLDLLEVLFVPLMIVTVPPSPGDLIWTFASLVVCSGLYSGDLMLQNWMTRSLKIQNPFSWHSPPFGTLPGLLFSDQTFSWGDATNKQRSAVDFTATEEIQQRWWILIASSPWFLRLLSVFLSLWFHSPDAQTGIEKTTTTNSFKRWYSSDFYRNEPISL